MKMPFGKHKGKEIEGLPTDYLKWIESNLEDKEDIFDAAVEELHSRQRYGEPGF